MGEVSHRRSVLLPVLTRVSAVAFVAFGCETTQQTVSRQTNYAQRQVNRKKNHTTAQKQKSNYHCSVIFLIRNDLLCRLNK